MQNVYFDSGKKNYVGERILNITNVLDEKDV